MVENMHVWFVSFSCESFFFPFYWIPSSISSSPHVTLARGTTPRAASVHFFKLAEPCASSCVWTYGVLRFVPCLNPCHGLETSATFFCHSAQLRDFGVTDSLFLGRLLFPASPHPCAGPWSCCQGSVLGTVWENPGREPLAPGPQPGPAGLKGTPFLMLKNVAQPLYRKESYSHSKVFFFPCFCQEGHLTFSLCQH